MNDYAKGIVIALGPEDGESLWQPLPSTGYVINKLNPYNSPYDAFSTGLQVLEPGAHVRRHAHERSHELLSRHRLGRSRGPALRCPTRNHDPDWPWPPAQSDEHRERADAPPLVHCAGGSGGLVPCHRPTAPGRRSAAGALRAPARYRADPGAAALHPAGQGVKLTGRTERCELSI